jgi:hypothetical protein
MFRNKTGTKPALAAGLRKAVETMISERPFQGSGFTDFFRT